MPSSSRPFFACLMLWPAWGNADLYTGHVASLEWKIHSSDLIYLVHLSSENPAAKPQRLVATLQRTLKQTAADFDAHQKVVSQWEPPLIAQPGQNWLLFVRTWDDKPPTIAHVINLTFPLKAHYVAAVTADGVPLKNEESVLKAIDERLKRNLQMTPEARRMREFVDQGPQPSHFHVQRFGDLADVAPWLGGFQKPIDCSFWDTVDESQFPDDPPIDEDLWLNFATVPADPEYYDDLLEYARWSATSRSDNRQRPPRRWPIAALVNYPGEKTNAVLKHDPAQPTYRSRFTEGMVLNYFQYYTRTDPISRRLLGRWQIQGQRETINIEFLDNHEFRAYGRPRPFPNPNVHRREWWGIGSWNVSDGKLFAIRRTVSVHRHQPRRVANARMIVRDKLIQRVTANEITLENGPKVVRLTEPLSTSPSPLSLPPK